MSDTNQAPARRVVRLDLRPQDATGCAMWIRDNHAAGRSVEHILKVLPPIWRGLLATINRDGEFTPAAEKLVSEIEAMGDAGYHKDMLLAKPVEAENTLTLAEENELRELEGIIATNIKGFEAIGEALTQIRDKRLYRQHHSTFQQYCISKWGIGARHAYNLIEAAEVVENLRTSGSHSLPKSERVTRELTQLSKDEQPKVWQKAQEFAGEKPVTAAHVRAITKPSAEPEPEFEPRKRRDKTVRSLNSAWKGSSREARIKFLEWLIDNLDTYPFEKIVLVNYAVTYQGSRDKAA